ncbi:MAG: hypothetical protein ACI35O_11375 [Bacillaceae bacterium]
MKSLKPFVSTYENKTYTVYATDAQEARNHFIENVNNVEIVEEELDLSFEEITNVHIVVNIH